MPLPPLRLPKDMLSSADDLSFSNTVERDISTFEEQHRREQQIGAFESLLKLPSLGAPGSSPSPAPMPTMPTVDDTASIVTTPLQPFKPIAAEDPIAAAEEERARASYPGTPGDGGTAPMSAGQRPFNPDEGPRESRPAVRGPVPAATGEIDNSSRQSFVRTAYPYALQAADGDPKLAQQLIATAISENGAVGTGRSLGEMGFNVGGIQGVKGPAGSFTALDAGRPREFAAYNNLSEGFRAVRDLVSGGRYAQAAANYRQHGDIDRYWLEVNRAGYSETPDWQDRIAGIRRSQVEPLVANYQPPSATQRASEGRAQAGETAQTDIAQSALDDPDKWALCGPVAAVIAAQRRGQNWTVADAKKLAIAGNLWDPGTGMHGLESQVTLLKNMGFSARSGPADLQALIADAGSGNTPIISTNRHYFILKGYDPKTGRFDTTTTGGALKGGDRWLTLDQIASLGGGIQGAAFFDNPTSPAPSVAAAPSAQPDMARGPSNAPDMLRAPLNAAEPALSAATLPGAPAPPPPAAAGRPSYPRRWNLQRL